MQHTRVGTTGDDRCEGGFTMMLVENALKVGCQFVFVHVLGNSTGGAAVCLCGNTRGPAHLGNFNGRFDESELVERFGEILEGLWWDDATSGFLAQGVQPSKRAEHQFVIRKGQREALIANKQFWKDIVKFIQRKGLIGAVDASRAFNPGARAIPACAFGIVRVHEQDYLTFRPLGTKHKQCVRFI
jgi:hypothetical protein